MRRVGLQVHNNLLIKWCGVWTTLIFVFGKSDRYIV